MALLAVAFYFLLTSYYSNVQINKYDSLEAVKDTQAMENGWVPKILPPSAYDIVESHDTDVFGKFSYREEDEADFLAKLKVSNNIYEGENFLFKIDKEKNLVNFRNKKPLS